MSYAQDYLYEASATITPLDFAAIEQLASLPSDIRTRQGNVLCSESGAAQPPALTL